MYFNIILSLPMLPSDLFSSHFWLKFNTYMDLPIGQGDECGKNKRKENFKTAIPSNNYDRPKTTGECGMF